jgi:DNA-binding winged helix-turn-helix (wHTH) protein
VLVFGRFELQPERRRLLQDGNPVAIGARAFDVLLALAERSERIVTKTELLDLAWPGLSVEENNLQVQISTLRKLLGPDAIATVPGRGYRFTAKLGHVEEVPEHRRVALGPLMVDLQGNLPAASKVLFGRQKELEATQALMRRHRLLTLHGPGGIGKSSLALALGQALRHEFSDGAWLVELGLLTDPSHVASEVARTLGIMLPGTNQPRAELALALRLSCLLLVLDNCEHVAATSRWTALEWAAAAESRS